MKIKAGEYRMENGNKVTVSVSGSGSFYGRVNGRTVVWDSNGYPMKEVGGLWFQASELVGSELVGFRLVEGLTPEVAVSESVLVHGMPLRLWIATQVLVAMHSNPNSGYSNEDIMVEVALSQADFLIRLEAAKCK